MPNIFLRLLWIVASCGLLFCGPSARAHSVALSEATVDLRNPAFVDLDLKYDVDPMLISEQTKVLSLQQREQLQNLSRDVFQAKLNLLRGYFNAGIFLEVNGQMIESQITFPNCEDSGTPAILPGNLVHYRYALPQGTQNFVLGSRQKDLGNLLLTFKRSGPAPAQQLLLLIGEKTANLSVDSQIAGLPLALQYVSLGFKHILPEGLDHILFILCLFLLSTQMKPLLIQVTAFTLAHSLTLGLALFNVFTLPSRVVEPIIALSIVALALENLWTKEMKPWRPFVVFGFGLLHGLGFAGALRAFAIPRQQYLTALLSFNIGVELGQITVIAMAFTLVGWFVRKPWYRSRIVIPASFVIAITAAYWTYQRIFLNN